MNFFNMIFVIAIAIILSISMFQADPDSYLFPKIFPDDASYVTSKNSTICHPNAVFCGYIGSYNNTLEVIYAELQCVCPSGQQCQATNGTENIKDIFQFYKCVNV